MFEYTKEENGLLSAVEKFLTGDRKNFVTSAWPTTVTDEGKQLGVRVYITSLDATNTEQLGLSNAAVLDDFTFAVECFSKFSAKVGDTAILELFSRLHAEGPLRYLEVPRRLVVCNDTVAFVMQSTEVPTEGLKGFDVASSDQEEFVSQQYLKSYQDALTTQKSQMMGFKLDVDGQVVGNDITCELIPLAQFDQLMDFQQSPPEECVVQLFAAGRMLGTSPYLWSRMFGLFVDRETMCIPAYVDDGILVVKNKDLVLRVTTGEISMTEGSYTPEELACLENLAKLFAEPNGNMYRVYFGAGPDGGALDSIIEITGLPLEGLEDDYQASLVRFDSVSAPQALMNKIQEFLDAYSEPGRDFLLDALKLLSGAEDHLFVGTHEQVYTFSDGLNAIIFNRLTENLDELIAMLDADDEVTPLVSEPASAPTLH